MSRQAVQVASCTRASSPRASGLKSSLCYCACSPCSRAQSWVRLGKAYLLPTSHSTTVWATLDRTWSLWEAGVPDRTEDKSLLRNLPGFRMDRVNKWFQRHGRGYLEVRDNGELRGSIQISHLATDSAPQLLEVGLLGKMSHPQGSP